MIKILRIIGNLKLLKVQCACKKREIIEIKKMISALYLLNPCNRDNFKVKDYLTIKTLLGDACEFLLYDPPIFIMWFINQSAVLLMRTYFIITKNN